ncbi:MAG: hypothetical protein HZA23_07130 [Nitrospirae bacterium]|nr:hypothetical protein [Nitrospirota bacterium]
MPTVRGEITVKVSPEAAYRFLLDWEKVVRLSPYWEVKAYRVIQSGVRSQESEVGKIPPFPPLAKGGERGFAGVVEVEVEHYRDGRQETLKFTLEEAVSPERIRWAVAGGARRQITFSLKEETGGVRIVQEEELESPQEDEAAHRRGEAELIFWLRSLREYLRLHERSTLWTRAFRWIMDRYWIPMSPSQRKVSILVIKITIAEFVIFLGIVLAFVLAGAW